MRIQNLADVKAASTRQIGGDVPEKRDGHGRIRELEGSEERMEREILEVEMRGNGSDW